MTKLTFQLRHSLAEFRIPSSRRIKTTLSGLLLIFIASGCASTPNESASGSATYIYVGSGYVYAPPRYAVSCRRGSLSVGLPSGETLSGNPAYSTLNSSNLEPVPKTTSIAGQRIVAISGQRCQRGYARRHGYAPRLIAVVGGRGIDGRAVGASVGVSTGSRTGVSVGVGASRGGVGGRVRLP